MNDSVESVVFFIVMCTVKILLLFSGKRKSGKDFLTELLLNTLGPDKAEILRISSPIKEFWAKEKNLSLVNLLSDGPYKESYRKEMIRWSDEQREKDYGFFCRETMSRATKSIVIISDVRRKNDIRWFTENYNGDDVKLYTIRIGANDEIRKRRGWIFESGIDDVQSECDLDDFLDWNVTIDNGNNDVNPVLALQPLLSLCAP